MTAEIPGVLVGHWTDSDARTGCTVVLLPPGSTASGEVRGGAPATREFALLDPQRTVENVDGVVLAGGSAFGLASVDGVARWLEENGRGFPTKFGAVPIVVGMGLFDLGVGDPKVRPGPEEGRSACVAATSNLAPSGMVGAGTGATTGKWGGPATVADGGFGTALVEVGDVRVWAGIAVNAAGFLSDGSESTPLDPPHRSDLTEETNTTIGVVVTNAKANKAQCHRLAVSGHDGFARSIYPTHTAVDGDALVVAATNAIECDPMYLPILVQSAVVQAIRSLMPAP